MFVKHKFYLDKYTRDLLFDMEPKFGFNSYGEASFYRTYSRWNWEEGYQEHWPHVIQRVIEGTFSIRKDWYLKNHISWNENEWQKLARDMAISAFHMEWLPGGRGLFAMGTKFIYERGGMALYNCSYSDIYFKTLDNDLSWIMDCLMLGVGVGFGPHREDEFKFKNPKGSFIFEIPDSREGWIESVKLKFQAYMYGASYPELKFHLIRKKGIPIKGFGGIASGPEPLMIFHTWLDNAIEKYMTDKYYDSVLFKTDCANQVGCMVVAGNVRRSAEKADLSIKDPVFIDIKNYKKYPDRSAWGWMSNNSVSLEDNEDFERLPEIASRIIVNGEPGFNNLKNFSKSRLGKKDKLRKDKGRNTNPCGEIILENKETCNIAETFPTICENPQIWLKACEYATLYCSTVSLLPTHQPSTNKVVARNRRIGIGIVDFTGWVDDVGMSNVIKNLRKGYKTVRKTNKYFNSEAGVPEAIRVTTVKPGGTTPKLAGKTSGCMYPNFHYMIRRMRVARNSPIHEVLVNANIPFEPDWVSQNTDVFEFPVETNLDVKTARDVSVWEQAMNLIILQREWSDNSVSNTLMFRPKWILAKHWSIYQGDENIEDSLENYIREDTDFYWHVIQAAIHNRDIYEFNEKIKINVKWNDEFTEMIEANIYNFDPRHEEDSIEAVLASIAPVVKTVSMLPATPEGVYKQMPEEGISREEYEFRLKSIKKIDWSQLKMSEGSDEKYCTGDKCSIE